MFLNYIYSCYLQFICNKILIQFQFYRNIRIKYNKYSFGNQAKNECVLKCNKIIESKKVFGNNNYIKITYIYIYLCLHFNKQEY